MTGNAGFSGWSSPAFAPSRPYINVQDQKAQNTAGGSFTSGAWRTRDLNTIVSDQYGLASVTNNQLTLAPGTYRCEIACPARAVGNHQARLQNISDGATTLLGRGARTDAASQAQTESIICGEFRIGRSTVFEVQHQTGTGSATTGFGIQMNFTTEVYTVAEFWKVG